MRRPLRSERARAIANLAIDIGDPGRMARARRLHRAGAVASLAVQPGEIEADVYGGEPQPYHVLIELVGGPGSSSIAPVGDLLTSCTCPDLADVCKHALAVVLAFAEEVEGETELLEDFSGATERSARDPRPDPTIDDDPFFTGSLVADSPSIELGEIVLPSPTSLIVDGVDAWPVLRNAIDEMAAQLNARRDL